MNDKIALVTGANKGIGYEVARQLGKRGITILVGARNETLGREAAEKLKAEGVDARFVRLDVTEQTTIERAASEIEREFGKLDILINNAGVADMSETTTTPSQLKIDVLRRIFETNFFGAFAVTKAMLPLVRKSEAGRIVNVSSGLGSLAQQSDADWEFAQINALAYCSSKTALNQMTVQFAKELRDTAIKVNSADPGYTATDLNHHNGMRTVEQGATVIVRLATLPDDATSGGFFDENGAVAW
jgi:NAD(P)-dependent dehydrogenase (short-subunit alcohol dehydrogenase family)